MKCEIYSFKANLSHFDSLITYHTYTTLVWLLQRENLLENIQSNTSLKSKMWEKVCCTSRCTYLVYNLPIKIFSIESNQSIERIYASKDAWVCIWVFLLQFLALYNCIWACTHYDELGDFLRYWTENSPLHLCKYATEMSRVSYKHTHVCVRRGFSTCTRSMNCVWLKRQTYSHNFRIP